MVIDGVDNDIKGSALELIGNTPLLALDRLCTGPGRILAKCEFMNPGASVKDRASLHMIREAQASGKLNPGQTVLELSSGNQGCGLAVVCAVMKHPLVITMPKGNSVQRALHMEGLGAKVIRVPQVDGSYGKVTLADSLAAEEEALKQIEQLGAYYVNQSQNPSNVMAHYTTTGPEIWKQSGRHVDGFVAAVGTSGTFTGVSKYLKEKNPNVVCYAVEPKDSEPLKGDPVTKYQHLLQGSGYARVPTLFEYEYFDGAFAISDEEAVEYKNLIGEKEGLFVGYTSAANVAAAVKLLGSGKLPPDAWVVTILPDTGLKYTPVPEELQ